MAKILVIDDNAEFLQMMDLILGSRGGHEVMPIADGVEGLNYALAHPPDLAIVDVMMPGITGYDVVRQLRQSSATANVPVMILTARGQPIDRQTALDAGADDHMVKPVATDELLDKVEELLQARVTAQVTAEGGRVVSLVSLRGGVGVTTLAVNLALTASRVSQRGTCLVDLSPASGQATLHLRLLAQKGWEALPPLGNNPNPDDLKSLLTAHSSGLQLLASPFEPIHAQALTASVVAGALAGLRGQFDLLVIDTPSLISEAAAAALDHSNAIVLVLTPEVGAIQSTVALLGVMNDMADKALLVLNHTSPQPGVPNPAVEKAVGRPLSLEIPYDPAQAVALAQGKPLSLTQPSSPLAMASRQLLAVIGRKLTGRPALRRLSRS